MYELSCVACVYSLDGLTKLLEQISRQTLNLNNGLQLVVVTKDSAVRDAATSMDEIKVFFKEDALERTLIKKGLEIAEGSMSVIIDDTFENDDNELFASAISKCALPDDTAAQFIHSLVPAITAKMANGASPCYDEIAIRLVNHLLARKIAQSVEDNFTQEQHERYVEELYALIDQISVEAISTSSVLILPKRIYLLSVKNRNSNIEYTINDKKKLCANGTQIYGFGKAKPLKFEIIEISNGNVVLEGFEYLSAVPGMKFLAETDNGAVYEAKTEPWMHKRQIGVDNVTVFPGSKFTFTIPVTEGGFRFYGILGDIRIPVNYNLGIYSHLDPSNQNAYYLKDNIILRYRNKHFTMVKSSLIRRILAESRYNKTLTNQGREDIVVMRKAYAKRKKQTGKLWVVRDNEDRARDSGFEILKFLHAHKAEYPELEDVSIRFILSQDSEDYENVAQYGDIVEPYTDEYKLTMLMADVVIDTRGNISSKYVFGEDEAAYRNLCTWDYIWLPHGVFSRNHSSWTHKFLLNAKLYASSGKREYDSIVDMSSGYGYNDGEVVLTGLPRQDGYERMTPEKLIVFMPTWRRHLAGDLIPGSSEREYSDKLKNSDFCKFYNALMNDDRLLSVMKEYGYTGEFYLHPSFIKQVDDMEGNDIITVARGPANTNDLVSRASFLVTDYSSVEFDAAYLRKPVVYSQYDADTFYNLHTGAEGYFNQADDGFGPVCYNLDDTVDAMIQLIKNGSVLEGRYLENANKFFKYNDSNNSRRIVERVIAIESR